MKLEYCILILKCSAKLSINRESHVYESVYSITQLSRKDSCISIVASQSNPSMLHIVNIKVNGNFPCDSCSGICTALLCNSCQLSNKGCPTLQFLPCIVIPYSPLCNTKMLSHFVIALAILCNTSKLPQVVIMLPQLFNKI